MLCRAYGTQGVVGKHKKIIVLSRRAPPRHFAQCIAAGQRTANRHACPIVYPGANYDPGWDMPQLIAQAIGLQKQATVVPLFKETGLVESSARKTETGERRYISTENVTTLGLLV